jgi:hypothetical protein
MTSVEYLAEEVMGLHKKYNNDFMKFATELSKSISVAKDMHHAERLEAELAGMKKFKEILDI